MTETLQQKIDAMWSLDRSYQKNFDRINKSEINQALQEFREAIKKLDTMTPIGFKAEYVDVKAVLALLGEKK